MLNFDSQMSAICPPTWLNIVPPLPPLGGACTYRIANFSLGCSDIDSVPHSILAHSNIAVTVYLGVGFN